MNLEKDCTINPEELDLEWLRQPQLYARYAQESAHAKDRLSLAKENLDVIKAKLDKAIRMTPSEYGVEKVTEGAITATLLQLPEYEGANKTYLQAKLDADLIQAAVSAMDHRRAALENLVRLHAAQYFAGPREPRDIGQEWKDQLERKKETRQQETRDAIRERLNPTTRRRTP